MKENDIIGLIDMIYDGINSTEYNCKSLKEIENDIVPKCINNFNISDYLAKYIAKTIYSSKQNLKYINYGFQQ